MDEMQLHCYFVRSPSRIIDSLRFKDLKFFYKDVQVNDVRLIYLFVHRLVSLNWIALKRKRWIIKEDEDECRKDVHLYIVW